MGASSSKVVECLEGEVNGLDDALGESRANIGEGGIPCSSASKASAGRGERPYRRCGLDSIVISCSSSPLCLSLGERRSSLLRLSPVLARLEIEKRCTTGLKDSSCADALYVAMLTGRQRVSLVERRCVPQDSSVRYCSKTRYGFRHCCWADRMEGPMRGISGCTQPFAIYKYTARLDGSV